MINITYIKNSYMDWFGLLKNYKFNTILFLSDCEYGNAETRNNYNFETAKRSFATDKHKISNYFDYMSEFYY